MMHQIVLPVFAALLLLVQPLHSQSVTVFGKEVSGPSSQAELGLNFKDFTVYQVDVGSLLDRLNPAETAVTFDFQLGAQRWNFQMEKVALKAGGYSVRVKTPQGIQQAVPVEIYTYQGRGPSGQLAALTLAPDFVYGFFEIGDDSWFIEPVWLFDPSANRDEFVVYRAADVKPGEDVHCGVKEISKKPVPVNPGINKVNSCLEAEVAIASDYLLFTTLGSVSAVETRNIGVLNNVAVNYRHEFTDNVELILVEQFVDSALPEEWTTSTDADLLLDDFSAWGPTGFTATHDLATLWTGRDLDGSTIGLAWVDAVCATNYRYNICQYMGVSWQDRVLQAHEMGHNFSANHDASGSPYIMAPAINNTSIWSAATVTSLNTNLPTYGCLATCTGSPVASFLAEPVTVCTGGTVQFKDKSQNGFTRTWTFQNGTPSSSTAQQPTVTYSTTGSHDVTIVSGSSSLTQANYITVDDPTTATCTTSGGTGGLTYFALNTISNSTATGSYTDYSCSDLTNLATNTVYGISVTIYCPTNNEFKGIRLYIDYNNDGDMSDVGEDVVESMYSWCGGIVTPGNGPGQDPNFNFTTPSSPVTGQILRARVIVNTDPIVTPCQSLTDGEAEDYGVYFPTAPLPVELVEFRGERIGEQVHLFWTTASETNNSHYNIQRATLGELFAKIGELPASDRPEQENRYEFVDDAPADGINYYRLEQVDLDGTVEYSAVVAIRFDRRQPVGISPNPANGQFQVLNAESAEVSQVLVYNINGQLQISRPYDGKPIDISQLNPGMYLVELTGPAVRVREKLLVR